MENQIANNEPPTTSPPSQLPSDFVAQEPPHYSHPRMDFSVPPHTSMYWPQQVNPNTTQTQYRRFPIPQPQTGTTKSTTAWYNDASASNSINYSFPYPTPYRNRSIPRNSTVYPRQFSQNAVSYSNYNKL